MIKIAVLGANGQIGRAIQREAMSCGGDFDIVVLSRAQCDLTDCQVVRECVFDLYNRQACRIFINAAAYTAVDKAEEDAAAALAVNWHGVRELAQAVAVCGDASLIHFSTDYVFDGAQNTPYREEDPVNPLNLYGLSKYAGELAVCAALTRHLIIRISWVFGPDGSNFLKTMLRLGAEKDMLSIVDDQLGAPTYSGDVARAVLNVVQRLHNADFDDWGLYHYTGTGPVSWYDFAQEIFKQYGEVGGKVPKRITAVSSAEFPQKALRPKVSFMNMDRIEHIFEISPCDWKAGIEKTLNALKC
ncbi:MAG: dTDP-4-dehydrorhamnose reductase [Rhodospirillales bacterium]|nr:dTDP-4-dehydrorhamnose reductase [Alphaproteobacteria bacterium]MCB9981747.1 dTDP-4-dehydrorhamnose reductase [Rhodospirillales bacterium]